MNTHREFHFGQEALAYIRFCLQERIALGKSLSRYLLERSNLEKGKIKTVLPEYVSNEQARKFQTSVLRPPHPETHTDFSSLQGKKFKMVPVPNMYQWLVCVIKTSLSSGKGKVCVFENALAESSDPWLKSSKSSLLIRDRQIYHLVTWKNTDKRRIERTIKEGGNAWLGLLGVLVAISENDFDISLSRQEISEGQLKVIAEKAEKIIVGAYDGEGYLVWEKH